MTGLALDLARTYVWRVDEVNEAETPRIWPGDLWRFATPACIGAMTNHVDSSLIKLFNGMIDEVRFCNRALSTEEILWLFGRTTPMAKPL